MEWLFKFFFSPLFFSYSIFIWILFWHKANETELWFIFATFLYYSFPFFFFFAGIHKFYCFICLFVCFFIRHLEALCLVLSLIVFQIFIYISILLRWQMDACSAMPIRIWVLTIVWNTKIISLISLTRSNLIHNIGSSLVKQLFDN